jgi:iron complex transport system ATP-binding protein
MGMTTIDRSALPAVRADGLYLRRGRRTVLDDVSLDVFSGELVAVVGPNGSGKSTLLRVLAGDLRPDVGHAAIDGVDAHRGRARDQARRRAVLTQQQQLAFGFLVEDVVAMGRAPWAGSSQAYDNAAHVQHALRCVAATHLKGRPVTELSGGEAARVHLARVLAQDTPVLLLDEPTAALDLGQQHQVLLALRRQADAGRAVLVVLHDLAAAAAHADRVVVLHQGRVVAEGPPAVVLTADRVGAVYDADVVVVRHPTTGAPVPLPA